MSDDDPDYDVGYRRPPKSGQFKKGQSGNPKGRPKGAKGVRASLKRELDRKVTIQVDGVELRVTKGEALGMQLANKALKGDTKATAEVLKLDAELFGMPETSPSAEPQTLQSDDLEILRHFAECARTGDWTLEQEESDGQ